MKKKVVLFCVYFFTLSLSAQGTFDIKKIKNINVSQLTESDIIQIDRQMKTNGTTIEQLESLALSNGMPLADVSILRTRLKAIENAQENAIPIGENLNIKDSLIKPNSPTKSVIISTINPLIYGSELFNNTLSVGFIANQNIATPLNYEIGANDVLKIIVYGVQEFSADVKVNNEGFIKLNYVGQVQVGGLSLEAATQKIKQQMTQTAFKSLGSGDSKLAITLGATRTIQVTIIGANRSGNYFISSLSTVLSALTEAGGPNEIGSYRDIQLIRDNKTIATIDLYQFLQNGSQAQNMGLKDRDVIKISPYYGRIQINGEVKRSGIFEILPKTKETFHQFLNYAGGFNDKAYTELIKVVEIKNGEKAIKDLSSTDFSTYLPKLGDEIHINQILDRFKNRVMVEGSVFRPDEYQLTDGMRISDLIDKAAGLKEEAFLGRAQLIRLQPNHLKEMISINIEKAMKGDTAENKLLKREDKLIVNSIYSTKEKNLTLSIFGEIKTAGIYRYIDSMTVKDLILLAGGFTYAADSYVEIARLNTQYKDGSGDTIATVIKTDINQDLSFTDGHTNVVLQPLDVVTITKKRRFSDIETIKITGQVQYEGQYALTTRVERVSDILKRSGGLIEDAYGKGAFIRRYKYAINTLQREELRTSIQQAYFEKMKKQMAKEKTETMSYLDPNPTINQSLRDSINQLIKEKENEQYQIAIDINYILRHPASDMDLILKNRDEIFIPKKDNRVRISGGVLRPTNIVYNPGLTVDQCLSAAGGISEFAKRGKTYVVYANGRSKKTRYYGLFRINPRIEPGCEIIVPENTVPRDKTITSVIQVTTILAQLATAVGTMVILTK